MQATSAREIVIISKPPFMDVAIGLKAGLELELQLVWKPPLHPPHHRMSQSLSSRHPVLLPKGAFSCGTPSERNNLTKELQITA